MSLEEQIFAGLVLVLGLPAMWRNWTSVGLVTSWALCQCNFYLTGSSLDLQLYVMIDIAVVALIFTKSALTDKITPWDAGILFLFALAWVVYVVQLHEWYKFWLLYGIAAAQLLLAAAEAWGEVGVRALKKLVQKNAAESLRVVAGHV